MYHYNVPLLELPKCFNTDINSIPYPDAYLDVSHTIIEKFNKQLGTKTKKRVGIVWSSNAIAFITRFRQAPLESLLQMLADLDSEVVNVEYDISTEERDLLNKYNVKCVDQKGFDDTAGLIKSLDLLITVDTVYAHLAGALGVPTFVMLADYGMDWRWFLKRNDSPFYNSVKLFRQHGDSNWLSVFNDIKNEIKSTT
jgi:ADP-heptose:LPS heptosyltransferase